MLGWCKKVCCNDFFSCYFVINLWLLFVSMVGIFILLKIVGLVYCGCFNRLVECEFVCVERLLFKILGNKWIVVLIMIIVFNLFFVKM